MVIVSKEAIGVVFSFSACMAAAPASKQIGRFDLRKESTHVAPKTKNWPWGQGVMERPSGRYLSEDDKPYGSRREGIFADDNDR